MPRIATYRRRWAGETPGSQQDEYARDVAVQRAEQQVQREGEEFVQASRERHERDAESVRRRATDLQNAARAIVSACQSRVVNVEEVGAQLADLDQERRDLRALVGSLERQQSSTEEQAADPLAFMEAVYDKYGGVLVHPLDIASPPPFRSESEAVQP